MNEARPGVGNGQGGQGLHHPTHPAHPIHPAHPAHPVHPTQPAHGHVLHGAGPAPSMKPPAAHETASIELVEDEVASTETKSKIRAFGVGAVNAAHEFKRPTSVNQTGAVRVRSFHGRLSEQGLEYLDNAINDWLERHTDVEVKFVTSTVGLFDGKIKEPALVLNVWY